MCAAVAGPLGAAWGEAQAWLGQIISVEYPSVAVTADASGTALARGMFFF